MKKIILVLLFPVLSMAKSGVGNGGFVIQCESRVMPLDYFEAEQSGLVLDVPKPFGNFQDSFLTRQINSILNRLGKLDPNRAAYYRAVYYRYLSGAYAGPSMFLDIQGLVLNSTQSADPVLQLKFGLGSTQVPEHCQLMLAAQQEIPMEVYLNHEFTQPAYLQLGIRMISTVWTQLDLQTQAGIIIHELFYHEYLQRGVLPQNSVRVRKLVGLLMSSKFEKLTQQEWNTELRQNHFSPMFPDFQFQNSACYDGYGICTYFGWPKYAPRGTFSNEDFGTANAVVKAPGEINICQSKVSVNAETNYFIFGEVPAVSLVSKSQDIDLSCYSDHEKIVLQVANSCKIIMEKQVGAVVSRVQLNELGKDCDSYLKNYSNQNLKIIGQPKVFVFYNQDTKSLNLKINVVPFSDVQVFFNGVWMRVNDSCVFNLQNGEVVSIDGK
jgi:hypothetical protein